MPVQKTLIAVAEFAPLDELISGLTLARILETSGAKVNLYLGKNNYSKRLQQLFPSDNLKLYQPNQFPHEFNINIKLQKGQEILGVRWDQTEEELQIFIESNLMEGFQPDPKVSGQNKFDRVYLLGGFDIRRVEEYALFKQHTDFDAEKIVYINNVAPPASVKPFEGSLVDPEVLSLAELVAIFAQKNNLKLSMENLQLLYFAAHNARILSGNTDKQLHTALRNQVQGKEIDPPEVSLTNEELSRLQGFWSGESGGFDTDNNNSVDEVANFLSLIQLAPQLNPLLPGFHGFIRNKNQGKTFLRSKELGKTTVFISDDISFHPEKNIQRYHYRRFEHFLMGWYVADLDGSAAKNKPVQSFVLKPVQSFTPKSKQPADELPEQATSGPIEPLAPARD